MRFCYFELNRFFQGSLDELKWHPVLSKEARRYVGIHSIFVLPSKVKIMDVETAIEVEAIELQIATMRNAITVLQEKKQQVIARGFQKFRKIKKAELPKKNEAAQKEI